MTYSCGHFPITPVFLAQVDSPGSLRKTLDRWLGPTAQCLLLSKVMLPFFFLVPPEDFPELLVQLGLAQEMSTFFDQPRGIDVVLSEKIDKFEELVVDFPVVECTLDPIEELGLVVRGGHTWGLRREHLLRGTAGRGRRRSNVLRIV